LWALQFPSGEPCNSRSWLAPLASAGPALPATCSAWEGCVSYWAAGTRSASSTGFSFSDHRRILLIGYRYLSPSPPPPNQSRSRAGHDVSTGQNRFPEHNGFPTNGPSRRNQRLGTIHGGDGEVRGAEGWVPDHPVMPNLIMVWKMSALCGGCRAGARLCPLGLARPLAPPFGAQTDPLPAGLTGGDTRPPPPPVAASF
jgi:hypothetical protein